MGIVLSILRILGLYLLLSLSFILGFWFGKITQTKPSGRLPTIREIQERIGAKPDGILGPETQRKWEEAINNQFAIEAFEKMSRSRLRDRHGWKRD